MGKSLYDKYPEAKRLFDRADEILNIPLSKWMFEGDSSRLTQTDVAQPAILTHSVASFRVYKAGGWIPDQVRGDKDVLFAGHSLGEYSALVACGCLSFEDALKAVRYRGQLMKESIQNMEPAMCALIGSTLGAIKIACEEVSLDPNNLASIANINSPKQIVISGSKSGVDKVVKLLMDPRLRGGDRAPKAIPLKVSAPFHSPWMREVEKEIGQYLSNLKFTSPIQPIIMNVDGEPEMDPNRIRSKLTQQITAPVQWVKTMEMVQKLGCEAVIEFGPKRTLCGLAKQCCPGITSSSFGEAGDYG